MNQQTDFTTWLSPSVTSDKPVRRQRPKVAKTAKERRASHYPPLYFRPVEADLNSILLCGKHKRVWNEHGESIMTAFHRVTGVPFTKGIRVKTQYTREPSNSYAGKTGRQAMTLSYSYEDYLVSDIIILARLCHELGHRLIRQHKTSNSVLETCFKKDVPDTDKLYDAHRLLFLFLIDVLPRAFNDESLAAQVLASEDWSDTPADSPEAERVLARAWNWAKALGPARRSELTGKLFRGEPLDL